MRLRFAFAPLCVALLALTSSCAPGRASLTAPAGPEPVAWDSTAHPDSVAAWALKGCRNLLGTNAGCVERALLTVLDAAGVAKAMAALDVLVERDGTVRRESHGTAHSLGIHAYKSPETVAETFAACPPTQMSGCYHGVVQGYFLAVARQGGVTQESIDALCEPHRSTGFLFFQCGHGMGHGVMAVAAHHLPRALELCDRAKDPFIRESCYGGAFMENIVAFTHPHHTAEAHASVGGAGEDEHAAHGDRGHGEHAPEGGEHAAHGDGHQGHGETAAAEKWKPLDPSEPLYPCTVVAEKYWSACYMNQTSAVLYMKLGDVGATAGQCRKAPERMRATCFRSLGRDVTALAERGHARSAELCARAGAEGQAWCVEGVAENLVNLAADPGEGARFCAVVEGAANKEACYRGVGRMLMGLLPTPERRETFCAAVEAGHVTACRAGAGLPAVAATATTE